jgi:hypothetical protein
LRWGLWLESRNPGSTHLKPVFPLWKRLSAKRRLRSHKHPTNYLFSGIAMLYLIRAANILTLDEAIKDCDVYGHPLSIFFNQTMHVHICDMQISRLRSSVCSRRQLRRRL